MTCSSLSPEIAITNRQRRLWIDKLSTGLARDRPYSFFTPDWPTGRWWAPQLPVFAEHYACYAIDLPGYGESTDPPEPFSYAEEIAGFISSTIGEPAALIGSSFGATRAFFTALGVSRKMVGPLVLANSAALRPETASLALEALWTEADAAWERGEHDRANQIEIEGWVDGQGRRDGQAPAHVRDYFLKANRAIWDRHDANPLPDETLPAVIEPERVRQPVLLIDSPYDIPDVLQSNIALLERLPHARYVSIPDAAHFPSYEQPERFNSVVLEFLDEAWGRSLG